MPPCQFGERQYELAANLELLARSGSFFAPTTSLEAKLGIDVALTPGDPRVWNLLGMQAPGGVGTAAGTPGGWPWPPMAQASPPFLLSLFIQYKRSTYLTRSTANEWHTHDEPYWRIELTAHQHKVLQSLETAVGTTAAVRYAAPKFWQHRDMWRLQGTGAVMDNSLLVAPGDVQRRHTRLTWSSARGLVGHSDAEPLRAETAADLGREILARAARGERSREGMRQHLAALSTAVAELTPRQRSRDSWREDIAGREEYRELREAGELIEPLADIATVAEAAHTARASWMIVAVAERP